MKHKNLVNNTKRQYYQKKIHESENHSKTVWSVVSEISKGQHTDKNYQTIKLKNHSGNIVEEPNKVANYFNEFFVEAPTSILNSLPVPGSPLTPVLTAQCGSRMSVPSFSEHEIAEILRTKIKI